MNAADFDRLADSIRNAANKLENLVDRVPRITPVPVTLYERTEEGRIVEVPDERQKPVAAYDRAAARERVFAGVVAARDTATALEAEAELMRRRARARGATTP